MRRDFTMCQNYYPQDNTFMCTATDFVSTVPLDQDRTQFLHTSIYENMFLEELYLLSLLFHKLISRCFSFYTFQ